MADIGRWGGGYREVGGGGVGWGSWGGGVKDIEVGWGEGGGGYKEVQG